MKAKVMKRKEDLHQMRVSLRRLRTAIAVFEPIMGRPQEVSDRQLAKVAKTLGRVRDLDVLRQWLKFCNSST